MSVRVSVGGIPAWIPADRVLGPGEWGCVDGAWEAELSVRAAADLSARLRGVGLGGSALSVVCSPALPRAAVRGARLEDARRRRGATPGFLRAGTRTDDEGRISLTPEGLALEVAALAGFGGDGAREVWDLGCGVGGNTVAFARAGWQVTAVERDAARLEMARHNARVYGVEGRVTWVAGDALAFLATAPLRAGTLLFVDPPWGADWDRTRCGLEELPLLAGVLGERRERRVWAKVPPSFAVDTLPGAAGTAFFGTATGDSRRVKFVLMQIGA